MSCLCIFCVTVKRLGGKKGHRELNVNPASTSSPSDSFLLCWVQGSPIS